MNLTVTLATQTVKDYTPADPGGSGMETEKTTERVPIRELVRYYLRLGVLGFGGPVALVGQMERELVGDKKWLSKEEMREGRSEERRVGKEGRCGWGECGEKKKRGMEG